MKVLQAEGLLNFCFHAFVASSGEIVNLKFIDYHKDSVSGLPNQISLIVTTIVSMGSLIHMIQLGAGVVLPNSILTS